MKLSIHKGAEAANGRAASASGSEGGEVNQIEYTEDECGDFEIGDLTRLCLYESHTEIG